jgi:hypothetical protein
MTAHMRIQAAAIETSLNFLRPMAERPVSYQYDSATRRAGADRPVRPASVTIADARPLAATLSLDVEGFALVRTPSAMESFDDEAEIRAVYYPEVERLIAAPPAPSRS